MEGHKNTERKIQGCKKKKKRTKKEEKKNASSVALRP